MARAETAIRQRRPERRSIPTTTSLAEEPRLGRHLGLSRYREGQRVWATERHASPHGLERLEVCLAGDLVFLRVNELDRSLDKLKDRDVRRRARLQCAKPGYPADKFRWSGSGELDHLLQRQPERKELAHHPG